MEAASSTTAVTADPALQPLVERVQQARARGGRLAIRGGGSKDFLGGPIQGEPLDTTGLRGISRYEPTELVITARAGTPLAEVEAALAERGQCLAFEPPRLGGWSTIGGVVAAGLAGPARASVGGVRDFLLGATLLNGRAEVLSFGGQVMKNVAGYDVARLLAGSMGVLGVILEVSLKVLPTPPATATLRFDSDEAGALNRLNGWGGQPLPLNASAWWDGTLVVRLSGAAAAVETAGRTLGGEAIPADLARGFWDGLRDQRDDFFAEAQRAVTAGQWLWRLSLPQTAAPLGLPGDTLIEWGGAQRWIVAEPAAGDAIRRAAAAAGGHAAVYRGGPDSGGPALSPVLQRLHRQLKAAFDPDGVFNPGRLMPGL